MAFCVIFHKKHYLCVECPIIWLNGVEKNLEYLLLVFAALVLTDTGKEFDPTMAPEADITLSADERKIGGLGIFLIRQIMNEVKYERIDGKNVLTLEKRL